MTKNFKKSGGFHPQFPRLWLMLLMLLLVAPLSVGFLYVFSPIYRFPPPQPFAGPQWFNPYQDSGPVWQRCNFHVHSRNWFGLTQGVNHPEDIRETYRRMGYNVLSISDYQHITPSGFSRLLDIPVYEHGYNTGKVHQIVLGARKVMWLDYPLGQTVHHKQQIINRLKESAEFVILAHPSLNGGYTPEDMARLSGYDAVEALNHFRYSLELWDAALSSGRAVWLFGGDDSHDVSIAGETGVRWTMINSTSKKRRPLIKALRNGAFYAASGRRGKTANQLSRLTLENVRNEFRILVFCSLPADIHFIGQKGKLRHSVKYASEASMFLTPEDTYIRVELLRPDGSLYLNPVIRWDGKTLPNPATVLDMTKTWLKRDITILLTAGLLILVAFRLLRRRKAPL